MSENDDPFFRMKQNEPPVLVMEPEEIFNEYQEEDIAIFVNEFYMVFSILEKLDQDYDQGDSNRTSKNIKKYKDMIKDWNRKYRDIILEFSEDGIQCALMIYLEDDLAGITALAKKMRRFSDIKILSKNKVSAVFSESGKGENSVAFENDAGDLKMIYSKEDMLKPESPEFRICTYYAMKDGFDRSVDILKKYKESFSFGSESAEKDGWNSRWNVRFLR